MCDINNLKQYFELPVMEYLDSFDLYDIDGVKYEFLIKKDEFRIGGFGKVFRGKKKDTGEEIIIKIPHVRNDTIVSDIMAEVDISQHIHQTGACKNKTIYSTFLFQTDITKRPKDKKNIVIVSQPLGLDMFNIFLNIKNKSLSYSKIMEFYMSVICQLLELLICLKESKVVHCDFKLENMILSGMNGNIMLIDYVIQDQVGRNN